MGFVSFADVAGNILPGGPGGSITGTVEIDYSVDPATVVSFSTLTLHLPLGATDTFSSVTLSQTAPGGPYTLHLVPTGVPSGIEHLDFHYATNSTTSTAHEAVTLGAPIPITLTSNTIAANPVCFAAGTLIRTPRGDVPIETLTAGDVIVTATGEYRPVKWVGHQRINCRNNPTALPIRIAANAIAPDQPSQDLSSPRDIQSAST